MKTLLILVLVTLPWTVFIIFAGLMRLKMVRAAGKLTNIQKWLGYPWLGIGYVLDFFLNITWGSLFFGIPREWTYSARLWYWSNQTENLKLQRRALRHRQNMLDSVDPAGIHRG